MGVRYEWANSDHVVMITYLESPWSWHEYQALMDVLFAEVGQETHPVATIVDVTKMGGLPKDDSVMSNLKRVEELMPANVFCSVVVGAPFVVTSFMNILTQIRPRAKQIAMFAKTMEEAHQMITKRYEALHPGQPSENKFTAITK